jgi:hypothetical protein
VSSPVQQMPPATGVRWGLGTNRSKTSAVSPIGDQDRRCCRLRWTPLGTVQGFGHLHVKGPVANPLTAPQHGVAEGFPLGGGSG